MRIQSPHTILCLILIFKEIGQQQCLFLLQHYYCTVFIWFVLHIQKHTNWYWVMAKMQHHDSTLLEQALILPSLIYVYVLQIWLKSERNVLRWWNYLSSYRKYVFRMWGELFSLTLFSKILILQRHLPVHSNVCTKFRYILHSYLELTKRNSNLIFFSNNIFFRLCNLALQQTKHNNCKIETIIFVILPFQFDSFAVLKKCLN